MDDLHKAKAAAYIGDCLKSIKYALDSKESTQQNSEITIPFPFCLNQKDKDGCGGQCSNSWLAVLEYFKIKILDMKLQPSTQSTAPTTAPEAEILGFLTKKWPDLTEHARGLIVAKVHAIQSTSAYLKDPIAHIRSLRLGIFNEDDILLKAVAYLSFKHKVNRK